MTDIFHPSVEANLKAISRDLPQSLLVSGSIGVGLTGIIRHLEKEIGSVAQYILPERDEKVDIEKGTISVSSIRRLYDLTRTIADTPRLIVIDYAERMGLGAQNAFLKLLEEPGINTHFVLVSHQPSRLLPTIRSRTRHLEVQPASNEQSARLLDELGIRDATKRAQLLFMANGLPAELKRLSSDDRLFEARAVIIRDARQFLQASVYQRLLIAQRYKDDRPGALQLLDDALGLVRQTIESGKSDLVPALEKLLDIRERVEANGNVRLHLATAMV